MNAYLKYIALPEVPCFSGRDRDYSWESFLEAFSMKYPRESWSGRELKALLKAKLTDKAKAQYEALPKEVRHGSFEGLVEALSAAHRADRQTRRVVALGKLRQLRKTETQTVAEFCVELERLSAKAYPEMDEVALATTRAQQLYEQLVHWPESYHLLEAMEEQDGSTYDNLKEAAMRVERRRLTLETVREPRFRGGNGEYRETWPQRRQETDQEDKQRATGKWGSQREGPSTRAGGDDPQEQVRDLRGRCFRCNERGHRAKECKYTNREELGSRAVGVEDQLQRLTKRGCQEKSSEDKSTNMGLSPSGSRCTTRVEISSRVWTALLDTGSEISIMPIGIFHQIKKDGGTLQEVPLDPSKRILDASGRCMRFSAMVEVPLKECGGEKPMFGCTCANEKAIH
ncbi:zinc knuckle [Ancylostoma caninum]|uniref:Zinc knuckle n=1 Tax=Ancylostoma caninum TaxID=29170 RepID=A0A368F1H9_ANCCA|nr:zinc knuckle [Ancylostoma caninum]